MNISNKECNKVLEISNNEFKAYHIGQVDGDHVELLHARFEDWKQGMGVGHGQDDELNVAPSSRGGDDVAKGRN